MSSMLSLVGLFFALVALVLVAATPVVCTIPSLGIVTFYLREVGLGGDE